nr:hypothetical protein [Bacteroidota bacterium]
MKKLLLLCVFIGVVCFSKAQTNVYHPFPNDSLVWLQELVLSDGMPYYYINQMSGDTTIGSFLYKKLYTSNWFTSPFYNPSTTSVYYSGAIRQDIPNKKVYRLNTSGPEFLLYDFDLSVGDTAHYDASGDTIFVAGIDSVLVNGVYHKSFTFTNAWSAMGFVPGDLIEGVGNSVGLDAWHRYRFEGANNLWCFSHKSVQQYPAGSSMTCAMTVGISDIKDGEIFLTVMPNPTSADVILSVGCDDSYSIEVKNTIGESVFSKTNMRLTESTIDLSNY